MIFYFTATGNCLYVAKQFDSDPISIAQEMKNETLHYEDETIGIVSPIYGGELPKIVRRFLEKATFQTEYLYMILTYGMNDSVAAEWAYYFGKSHKVNFDYIHTMRMVDNYTPVFDMNEQKAMDKQIPEQLKQLKDDIKNKVHDIQRPTKQGKELYEMASRRPIEANNGSLITIDTDKCIGCGMCSKVCPIGNFYVEDNKVKRHNSSCEFCLACVHACSKKAIFTPNEKNRENRYINENIKLTEIIHSNQQ